VSDAPGGRVVLDRFDSRVLRGNRPGDPTLREVPVYLPPGYDARSNRRWPVVFVLAGFTGFGRMLLNRSAFSPALDQRMDRLVASGAARGALLVLPDCMTRFGGSQYVNSGATGRYEDYIVDELVPFIDARYRTKAEARHRGVLGKSSGGYGALVLGMRHPDVFSAVVSHSGDCLFEWGYAADFPKALDTLVKAGGVEKFLAAFRAAPKKSHDMVTTLNIVAMAACYSPNPKAPLGFDLPFDLVTYRPRPEVFERWLAHDPVRMARGHAAALRKLRLLYLDCGRRDEWHLHLGARSLSAELKRLRVRHAYEEFDDGHMDIAYRYDVSLPKITRAIA
jgi:hypothetical protein